MSREFKDNIASALYEMGNIPFLSYIEQLSLSERAKYVVPIRTSVGCNGFCSFCYRPFHNWHGIPAERVNTLFDHYTSRGFTKFLLVDENFIGTNLPRIREIADHLLQIKDAHPSFSFEFDARADGFGDYRTGNFEHNLVDKLRRAGLFRVFTGIEGGNNPDLFYYRKYTKGVDPLKQNIFYLSNMRQHGVYVESGFIMLNEESDLGRVRDNITFIHDYLPPEIVPEMYWYKMSYRSGSELTRIKIRGLTSAGDYEAIRKLAYGELKLKFKRPEIQRFSSILDAVKAKFLGADSGFGFELRDNLDLMAKSGNQIRYVHTSYFRQYTDIAEVGNLAEAPVLVESHYQAIRNLCI